MKLSSVIVRRYWIMRCDRWFNEICANGYMDAWMEIVRVV